MLTELTFVSVRGCRPGKTVQMTEAEVRALCLKSREIFLSQPILLELEAPLKICGKFSNLLHILTFYLLGLSVDPLQIVMKIILQLKAALFVL